MFGIDREFYQLLNSEALAIMNFPINELNPEFFKKYSDRIFYEPYKVYEASIVDQREDKVISNWEWYNTIYILFKSFEMKFFVNDLLEYCFLNSKTTWKQFSLPDFIRSLTNEYRRLIKAENLDSYRDHNLHSGMVFLFGLWLYLGFQPLKEEHLKMLEKKPQARTRSGCKALIQPNQDVHWQFFQQWIITSFFHDLGRFIEKEKDSQKILKRLEYINNQESQWLERIKKEGYSDIPSQKIISYDTSRPKLEIDLYTINYPQRISEEHISNNMWEECLEEINRREESLQDNHGIHSSKILLKLANFSTKVSEIYDQQEVKVNTKDPWKRFSYRNYILPALAIASHDDPGLATSLEIPGEITIPIGMLEKDFLTTLIIYCDELAAFDRAGGGKPLRGIDYRIELIESRNAIRFNIIES